MSFWSGLKKIFSLSGEDEAALKEMREKHGIDAKSKEEILREAKNEPGSEGYDAWEDLRNMRAYFFLGSWATKKFKFRPIGEEKLKRDLEKLAKKREEKEAKRRGEGKIE
jgi:hypothetical protein